MATGGQGVPRQSWPWRPWRVPMDRSTNPRAQLACKSEVYKHMTTSIFLKQMRRHTKQETKVGTKLSPVRKARVLRLRACPLKTRPHRVRLPLDVGDVKCPSHPTYTLRIGASKHEIRSTPRAVSGLSLARRPCLRSALRWKDSNVRDARREALSSCSRNVWRCGTSGLSLDCQLNAAGAGKYVARTNVILPS